MTIDALRREIGRRFSRGGVALDAATLFGGFGAQTVLQVLWLLLALHLFGLAGYGILAAITAIAVAATPLAGPGCDQMLIRGVARNQGSLRLWLGHGILAIGASGVPIVLLLCALLAASGVAELSTSALLAFLVSEILFGRLAIFFGAAYMAVGRAGRQALMGTVAIATRTILGAVAAMAAPGLTLEAWAWWHLGAAVLAAAIGFGLAVRDHAWPVFRFMRADWIEGLAFGAEAALHAASADLDKPVVLALLGPLETGVYTTASRAIAVLSLPMRALGYAVYGRLFRLAATDRKGCYLLARKLVPATLALGGAAAIAALCAAAALPELLDARHRDLAIAICWMCANPAALALFNLGADTLGALGGQRARLGIAVVGLAAALTLVALAAPMWGVPGVIVAKLAVTLAMVAAAWHLAKRAAWPPGGP